MHGIQQSLSDPLWKYGARAEKGPRRIGSLDFANVRRIAIDQSLAREIRCGLASARRAVGD